MSQLMADGLGLLVLGMGTVFVFLTILIFATGIMSKLVMRFAPEPVAVPVKPTQAKAPAADPQLLKVLSTAVKEYRNRQK
ncbi:MAG: OadG family protein [Oceanospirillaceae bacterium]|nr:OadG family protein [Oceanospirillaceae bacterium]MCP5349747.1 OadG family protein [Oceanospirillaceae bacterium]